MMESKKEEAIRKAYGEYWEKMSPELQTIALHSDGWIQMRDCIKELGADFSLSQDLSTEPHFNSRKQRPKSLQGIENNNGWIRIESEDDLPKESGWFKVENNNHDVIFYTSSFAVDLYDLIELYEDGSITHYKRAERSKKPIY